MPAAKPDRTIGLKPIPPLFLLGRFNVWLLIPGMFFCIQAAAGKTPVEIYAQGQSGYPVGSWLAAGGLAVMFIPSIVTGETSDPAAALGALGLIAYEVGVPMMGINANRMARAVTDVNSAYARPMSGWLWYGTGKGLQGFAFMMAAGYAFQQAFAFFTPPGHTPSTLLLDLAVYPLLAGLAFEVVSWYQFSRVHASAAAHAPQELKLSFRLQKGSGNLPIPGAVLALNF